MQLQYGYDNHHAREQANKLSTDVLNLADSISQNYNVEIEDPSGVDGIGLHLSTSSTLGSTALALANLALAAAATGTAIAANVTQQDEQFDNFPMCKSSLCWASYTLGAAAIGLSTFEQHHKRENLKRWQQTLSDGIATINNTVNPSARQTLR